MGPQLTGSPDDAPDPNDTSRGRKKHVDLTITVRIPHYKTLYTNPSLPFATYTEPGPLFPGSNNNSTEGGTFSEFKLSAGFETCPASEPPHGIKVDRTSRTFCPTPHLARPVVCALLMLYPMSGCRGLLLVVLLSFAFGSRHPKFTQMLIIG